MWWGRFDFDDGQAGRWQIGPLRLTAIYRSREWSLAHDNTGDSLDETLEVGFPIDAEELVQEGTVIRYLADRMPAGLVLTPVLGDRPMVHRPETPLRLLGEEEVELFVSSPVWLRIETCEDPQILAELPTWRPSDTWFGPPNHEGELCYSTRTSARFNVGNLPLRPHRAVTKIQLRNTAPSLLQIERLNLPMPNLSLYSDRDGHLWTQVVKLERDREGSLAKVDLAMGPPFEAISATEVAPPRVPVHRNFLVQALDGLLG